MYSYRTIRRFAFVCILWFLPGAALAQDAQTFQNFFLEGSQQRSVYGEVGLIYSDFDFVNVVVLEGQIGIPIGQSFELGITLDFLTIDPDFGDNASGFSDPTVVGRFQVQRGQTDISVGGGLTLPFGDEDIGGGESVDINIFGALRHLINANLAITGVLGIDFFEQSNDDYDASLRLGGALIYRTTPNLQLIGELNILTKTDYALLNFGVDYRVGNSTRLRPAIGLGVDNGAPDFVLVVKLLFQ